MNGFVWLTLFFQVGINNADQFNGFLILGYGVMWLIGMVYIISLITRQQNVEQDIKLMRQILQEDEETAD